MIHLRFLGAGLKGDFRGSVSQGAISIRFESSLPVGVEPSPSASVSITTRRMAEGVAPDPVFLDISVSGFDVAGPAPGEVYDPSHHELYYLTDWDDEGAVFTAPQNVPDEWRNANVGYGPFPAHVYQKPGTYNPSVLVIDRSGNWATASVEIVVRDPAAEYPGPQTICVANDGDFTGAPSGCQRATSFDQGWNWYRNMAAGTRGRLLLKRGEAYETFNRYVDDGFDNWYLGKWGDEALDRPLIRVTPGTPNNNMLFNHISNFGLTGGIRYDGIALEGLWDATTETGNKVAGIICNADAFNLVNDCSGRGLRSFIKASAGSSANAVVVVNNSSASGWQDIGLYFSGNINAWAAMLGCCSAQDPNANMGAGGKSATNIKNDHGPLRIQKHGRFYADGCDFFSRNAWEQIHAKPTEQACIRYHSNDSLSKAYFSRISLEGGQTGLTVDDATSGGTLVPVNVVIDKLIGVGSWCTQSTVSATLGGVTVRNALSILPNTPRHSFATRGNLICDTPLNLTTDLNRSSRVAIYSCSMLNLIDDANLDGYNREFTIGIGNHTGFTNPVENNNVTIAPNSTAIGAKAVHSVTDFDRTLRWSPRNLGAKYQSYTRGNGDVVPAVPTLDATYATPTNTVMSLKPLTNIPRASGGLSAFDDLLGRPRYDPVTKVLLSAPAKGAMEA